MTAWVFQGDDGRADVLAHLLTQYADAMNGLRGPTTDDPFERLQSEMRTAEGLMLDPRLERLFPPALDDGADARQFRQHALPQQAGARLDAAMVVLRAVESSPDGNVLVEEDDIDAWVMTLSGLRATWHVELTGSSDRMAEPTHRDIVENQAVAAVCDWLGWLVEDALEALRGGHDA